MGVSWQEAEFTPMVEIKGLVPTVWAEPVQGIEAPGEWPSPVSKPKGPAEKGVLPGRGCLAGHGQEATPGAPAGRKPGIPAALAAPAFSQCLPLAEPHQKPEAGVPENCAFWVSFLVPGLGADGQSPRSDHPPGWRPPGRTPSPASSSALSLFPWAPPGCPDDRSTAWVTRAVVLGPRDDQEAEGARAMLVPAWSVPGLAGQASDLLAGSWQHSRCEGGL